MQKYTYFIIAAVSLLLISCSSLHYRQCDSGLQIAIQETLYLGTKKKDGEVTNEEWAIFLEEVVTPRFPDGFTVTPSYGQWRGGQGRIVKEHSYILTIFHYGLPKEDEAIQQIISLYKQSFKQEAVLRVQDESCISF